jgi:acetyl-CoA C-acetyltransferase
MHSAFICAAKRTAVGNFQGALASQPAPALGAAVVRAVISHAGVPNDSIDQLIFGNILSAGLGQSPARQVALFAGLTQRVQALTLNKVCSSGLKAVMLAADAIALGHAEAVIAGGMENMSRAPYLMPALRDGARLGHSTAVDSLIHDALWDVYNDFHMGNAGELCASHFGFSREAQDAYAVRSYEKAREAIAKGYFIDEIVPIEVTVGRNKILFSEDEEPARGDPAKMPTLRPVFSKEGTVTAGNASPLSDGAAAMIVCSEAYVKQYSLQPMARILSQGWAGQAPEWFTTAPIAALRMALDKANLSIETIDLFEINEAFSNVAMACAKELSIPDEKLNICGGAVALGHPLGASGAKILTTLLYSLARENKRYGAVGICNGGGEATSLIVERC